MKLKSFLYTAQDAINALKEKGVNMDALRKAASPSEILTQFITSLATMSGNYKGDLRPAADYNGLLRQFNALQQLNVSFGKQLDHYRTQATLVRENPEEIKRLQAEVYSERQANEQLTQEIEKLSGATLENVVEIERLKLMVLNLGGDPEVRHEVG